MFWRFDHAANAKAAELDMRRATVVYFGDARVGTTLMQTAPTLAIDLPHRALVWFDARGETWLGCNDPTWLARRHGIADDGSIPKIAALRSQSIREAAGGESERGVDSL
ncbi:MAG TPA: DUF302 domain-containing protein [Kofleriaceae bacterium]|nr:DUF302 domain-containing protein [Kofleriaceae bacterium]